MKEDEEFPEPIAIINQRTLVFDEQDVINYEKKREELTDINHKHYLANGRFKYFLKYGYVYTKGKS